MLDLTLLRSDPERVRISARRRGQSDAQEQGGNRQPTHAAGFLIATDFSFTAMVPQSSALIWKSACSPGAHCVVLKPLLILIRYW